jgi:Na+(H+)/acetate symporter ActP
MPYQEFNFERKVSRYSARRIAGIIALVCVIIALLILIEQQITWGMFFDLGDFLHHENFAIILLVIGITMFTMLGISCLPCTSN